ncbi:LysR family transcriptional regulator [Clostridium fungisolvens]|uniref:HTH-type transcriptional regulator GltC n=1 Tax=Clostridium fungisolvens TaxID=1604897 RepID=A0A6V8SII5_9CLOT|nr:LysR family transcriptional regulator [Clostridium fungisolvens]GFP77017.1 HTH-type transcriptional regulator GltC [Clostridium fungisolvens]
MEIRQLKFFIKVAENKNFTLAAEELCISQSSLSKHIKTLENQLGVKLFDRSKRRVKLTEAGIELLDYANIMINTYNEMHIAMNEYKGSNRKTLTIGTIPVMTQYGIPSLVASFTKKNTDIDIAIIEGTGPEVLSSLNNSEIDLALIRTVSLSGDSYKINPLIDDDLVMIVSKNHQFAKKSSVDLGKASKENFIFLDSGAGIYDISLKACRESGFEPKVIYNYSRIETIIGIVAEGIGISLLMRKVVEFFNNKDVVMIELDKKITSTLALVAQTQKKPTEAMNKFYSYTDEWLKENKV